MDPERQNESRRFVRALVFFKCSSIAEEALRNRGASLVLMKGRKGRKEEGGKGEWREGEASAKKEIA